LGESTIKLALQDKRLKIQVTVSISLTRKLLREKDQLNTLKQNQDQATRDLYELGDQSTLDSLFSGQSISDLIDKNEQLESLQNHIVDTIDQVNSTKGRS
jgi:hypothetical protein